MRKFYTLFCGLTTVFSFAQVSDSFTGTGALNANGWLTHSGATPGQLVIATGSLSYPGFTTSGNKAALVAGNTEDVNTASAAPLTGVVYYSAILNVPNTTGLNANTAVGDYFLATGATAGASVTAFSARIYVRTGATADTFNLGVLNNSGGTAAPSYVSTNYPVNVPVFVVLKYELTSNTASIFINPALGGAEGTANATNATGTTAAPAQIGSMIIRQGGNATAGTGNVEIDELRLNTTWASVTTNQLSTKENAIDGLAMFPNPLSGQILNITSKLNGAMTAQIFDVSGKEVLNSEVINGTVNVGPLNAGVYMVNITSEGISETRKLIIK